MTELSTLQLVIIWVVPVLFAITVHEAAHGWAAFNLGDDTAQSLGRITLNPIKHIDPIGTVILPTLMLMLTSFVFGWAKPVPVNFRRLRNPRRDMAFVALAGPASNLLMAIFWAIIAQIGWLAYESFPITIFFVYMGSAGIFINAILMVLNLLPILPLDGGRILYSLLPTHLATPYAKLEPFGIVILLVLLFMGGLGKILIFPVVLIYTLMDGSIWILQFILGGSA
jgi:Zn-dependent protease